jgi:hypothetical protein
VCDPSVYAYDGILEVMEIVVSEVMEIAALEVMV